MTTDAENAPGCHCALSWSFAALFGSRRQWPADWQRFGNPAARGSEDQERGYADPYGVAAHVLLDALNSSADKIPELRLGDGLEAVQRRLMELVPRA